MALLEILKYPDSRLRIKAKLVTKVDEELRRIVDDMYETMYHAKGVGLAGTQVNLYQQIFTMDVFEEQNQKICVLNPDIIFKEGIQYDVEGCLSVGGNAFDKVERALKVKMRGVDLDFKPIEMEVEGLTAVCIQHEVDHLNGILFIDHLSRLKQDRIRKKIEKSRP